MTDLVDIFGADRIVPSSGSVFYGFNDPGGAGEVDGLFEVGPDLRAALGLGPADAPAFAGIKIGAGAPSAAWPQHYKINVDGENDWIEFGPRVASNAAAHSAGYEAARAGGTLAAPSIVPANAVVNRFQGRAYDGSNFQISGILELFVDGTPGLGNVPMGFRMLTGTDSGNTAERLKVFNAGIRIGDAYTLPLSAGTAGQVLKHPASGSVLEWGASGGGDVSKAGSPVAGRMAYWTDDSTLGHKSGFTFDVNNDTLHVPRITIGGTLTLDGQGQLADPQADRLFGWDDSAKASIYFAPGTGLEISGTSLQIADAYRPVGDQPAWWPATAIELAGASAPTRGSIATANNGVMPTIDFDDLIEQRAHFFFRFPDNYTGGPITLYVTWGHAAGASTFGVTWGFSAAALGDGISPTTALGTEVTLTDTADANNRVRHTVKSPAITPSGTAAAGKLGVIQIARKVAHASDNLDVPAQLIGISPHYGVSAGNVT